MGTYQGRGIDVVCWLGYAKRGYFLHLRDSITRNGVVGIVGELVYVRQGFGCRWGLGLHKTRQFASFRGSIMRNGVVGIVSGLA